MKKGLGFGRHTDRAAEEKRISHTGRNGKNRRTDVEEEEGRADEVQKEQRSTGHAMAMPSSQNQQPQRWRYLVAAHNLAGSPTYSCDLRTPPQHEAQNLSCFISSISSPDLVTKTEALHQLSLFLLYLCPSFETSFSCPDASTISFVFTKEEILVPVKDIEALYRVLFSELASYTDWLFKPNNIKLGFFYKICSDVTDSCCDGIHLMLLVEILRCCIRTLPLLEYDTCLSLVAAEILASLFKQLRCPTRLGTLASQNFKDVDLCGNEVQFPEFAVNGCGATKFPVS